MSHVVPVCGQVPTCLPFVISTEVVAPRATTCPPFVGLRVIVMAGIGILPAMNELTQILQALERGEPQAAERLLPLVYDELRRLAAARLSHEAPGQTLQATALVHEAYLRLIDTSPVTPMQGGKAGAQWDGRSHFFGAAAEAMRRILVERARHKGAEKHGGRHRRIELGEQLVISDERSAELLALDEALTELERHDEPAARLVKLRYFAGLSHQEAAETMGITRRAADRLWALARAWLFQRLHEQD